MSRSKRKTPIYGICGGSEKEDKHTNHGIIDYEARKI